MNYQERRFEAEFIVDDIANDIANREGIPSDFYGDHLPDEVKRAISSYELGHTDMEELKQETESILLDYKEGFLDWCMEELNEMDEGDILEAWMNEREKWPHDMLKQSLFMEMMKNFERYNDDTVDQIAELIVREG
jgi:hypothetical protein